MLKAHTHLLCLYNTFFYFCAATIIRFMKIRFLRIFFREHEKVFSKLHTPIYRTLKPKLFRIYYGLPIYRHISTNFTQVYTTLFFLLKNITFYRVNRTLQCTFRLWVSTSRGIGSLFWFYLTRGNAKTSTNNELINWKHFIRINSFVQIWKS